MVVEKHPYEWEMRRLEALLDTAATQLGSEVPGGKARAAVYIGTSQELLRNLSHKMWDIFNKAQKSDGSDNPVGKDGK